ncbi:hypothetical protein [Stutzerimonas kunmingensis]|uniref:hypothetical protein n=1 Tax=Stutzerimonas kunmingensis TaxID=1211807 RepID=UPI00241F3242|nr:hypothetical protein [Stutzerimonas kunmingensis]
MHIKKNCQSAVRAALGLKKHLTDPLVWDCVLSLLPLLPLQILAFIGLMELIQP